MNTTHTPGPWTYRVWDYSKATPPRQELCIESESFRLAVLDSADAPDNPYTVPADEAQANARLIAAAPDLLAALQASCIALQDCERRLKSLDGEVNYPQLDYQLAENYDIINKAKGIPA